jgi:hypothetical protein
MKAIFSMLKIQVQWHANMIDVYIHTLYDLAKNLLKQFRGWQWEIQSPSLDILNSFMAMDFPWFVWFEWLIFSLIMCDSLYTKKQLSQRKIETKTLFDKHTFKWQVCTPLNGKFHIPYSRENFQSIHNR